MLVTVVTALATVPQVLQKRTFGIGVHIPVSGLPFTTSSSGSEQLVQSVTWLFVPRVDARFQLGRIGLAPSVGVRRTAWASEAGEGWATTARLGLDARAYVVNAGPVHLVGLAGVQGSLGTVPEAATVDGQLHTGGGVEWIPSERFSLGLQARLPLASASRSKQGEVSTSWSVGLGGISPSVAAHVWL